MTSTRSAVVQYKVAVTASPLLCSSQVPRTVLLSLDISHQVSSRYLRPKYLKTGIKERHFRGQRPPEIQNQKRRCESTTCQVYYTPRSTKWANSRHREAQIQAIERIEGRTEEWGPIFTKSKSGC